VKLSRKKQKKSLDESNLKKKEVEQENARGSQIRNDRGILRSLAGQPKILIKKQE